MAQTDAMTWVKIIHILCVMGWMTSIFAVPRALIYWKREHDRIHEFGPLGDLTVRLYRFSLGLGVIAILTSGAVALLLSLLAILTGFWLAGMLAMPDWVWWKLALVLALAAHYGWTGRMVLRARKGVFTESDRFLRIFNEVSVFVVIAILWVVVAQPV